MVHLGPFKKYVARGLLVKTRWSRLSKGKLNKDTFMNQLKNIKVAGAMLIAGAISPLAMADTVVLTPGLYSYSDGGEFTAVTTPTLSSLDQYSSYTSTSDSFQTFCVQDSTEFAPGVSYTYTLSSISLGGPTGGLPNYAGGNVPVGTANSYPLSLGTAWLYYHFATGTLAEYNFANVGGYAFGSRNTDAGLLQAAIWELQGGQVDGSYPNGGAGNIYYDEALAALGSITLTNAATPLDNYGVEIMNLTSGPGDNNQNQLVLCPDGGSSLMLLGAALSGLGLYRRRG
jgi:hypothetical protein